MEFQKLPNDYSKPFISCFELLKNNNLVIFEDRVGFKKYIPYVYILPCFILFPLSMNVYIIDVSNRGAVTIEEMIFVVPVYVVIMQTVFKAAIVVLNKEKIRDIIVQLGNIWRTTDLSEEQIKEKNVLLRRLNFCYTVFRIIYFYLGTEFVMITLTSHLSTEFTLLRYDLVHLKPENSGKYDLYGVENKKGLMYLIKRHQTLIALTKYLDDIFNKMIFINLLSATMSICFFGFSAKVAHGFIDGFSNFVAVVAITMPIFNLCYYAEILKESSVRIGDAAYKSLWYKGSKAYQKNIFIIIMRSQRPCYLTILKLMPITLCTFTTVMSNTWSYFSLVSSLLDD